MIFQCAFMSILKKEVVKYQEICNNFFNYSADYPLPS